MSRFYLHLYEQGKVVLDGEGIERPDLASAQRAAVNAARDVMAADVRSGFLDLSGRIDIADGVGAILASLRFGDALSVIAMGAGLPPLG